MKPSSSYLVTGTLAGLLLGACPGSARAEGAPEAPAAAPAAISDSQRIEQLELELQRMREANEEFRKALQELKASQEAAAAEKAAPAHDPAHPLVELAHPGGDHEKEDPWHVQGEVTVRVDGTKIADQTDLLQDDNSINGLRTRTRFGVKYNMAGPLSGNLYDSTRTLQEPYAAGIRISTAENPNPTSPFMRLGDLFRPKQISFDHFYLVSQPMLDKELRQRWIDEQDPERKAALQEEFDAKRNMVTLALGKMPQPFWTGDRDFRSETVWDSDINPEGVAMNNSFNLFGSPNWRVENTFGYFIVEEVDPNRFAGLTGDTRFFGDQLRLHTPRVTVAAALYDYRNLNAGLRVPGFTPGSSTFPDGGTSAFLLRPGLQRTNNQVHYGSGALGFVSDRFRMTNLTAQVHVPLGRDIVENLGKPELYLMGDYVRNSGVSRDNTGGGFTIGFRGGDEEALINPFNVWFTSRSVDNDATLATFADSDLGAGTGYRGFELGAKYKLNKNFLVQFSYFNFDGFPNKSNRVTRNFLDFVYSW